jgi:site-specific DNA recombinase
VAEAPARGACRIRAVTRVAIYARYSSDRQSDTSIEAQVERCRRWLAQHRAGIEPAHVLTDYAISGASLDRPGWQRIEQLVRSRAIDLLVVTSMDRISRDSGDSAHVMKRLRFYDVVLHAIGDGIDTTSKASKIQAAAKAMVSDIFLDDLADKTRTGMERAVRGGFAACAVPFGYATREHDRGRAIEVDEPRAAIVRRIFTETIEGKAPAQIAARLNAEGVAPPRSSRRDRGAAPVWAAGTIRSMVQNETYAGVWVWNRREWRKVPGENRRVCRERPPSEWIRDERPHLAIVDRETWDRANVRDEPRAEASGRGRRAFLLSGILRCGACGALMAIHGGGDGDRRYYRCSRANATHACDNRLSLRELDARTTLVGAIRDELLDRDVLADTLDAIAEALREESGTAADERTQRLARLARAETKIRRLVEAIADGGSAALTARIRELEAEARAERAAIAALDAAPSPDDLPTPDEALDAVRELVDVLADGDIAAGRERLRACLSGGAVRAVPHGGTYVLEAGVLPPMLLGGARSDRSIAGAGFATIRAPVRRTG